MFTTGTIYRNSLVHNFYIVKKYLKGISKLSVVLVFKLKNEQFIESGQYSLISDVNLYISFKKKSVGF